MDKDLIESYLEREGCFTHRRFDKQDVIDRVIEGLIELINTIEDKQEEE